MSVNTRHLSKLSKSFGFLVPSFFVLAAVTLPAATLEPKLTTLYSFCSESGCPDGSTPYVGLVAHGNTFYGTTFEGGAQNQGTVYSLTRKPKASAFTETVLYSFCSKGGSACTDGAYPYSGVVIDRDGNIFGTTTGGGANSGGAVYKLAPNAEKTAYTETPIYSFCTVSGCGDGKDPDGGVILDEAGHLYGTTVSGGAHGLGVVFELSPNPTKTAYREKVLYSFCAKSGCADGEISLAPLVIDAHHNLYGTADGGAHEGGVVFALIFNPEKHTYSEHVLYSFCAVGGSDCTDGYTPGYDSLLMDKHGDLFGVATYGGKFQGGVVFELTRGAGKSDYDYVVLYNFCSATDCNDGANPIGGLVADKTGNLYGTTYEGGTQANGNGGTVFKLAPNGTAYTEVVLYSFCGKPNCTDGIESRAGLLLEKHGNLLGTTQAGGAAGLGTVFLLQP